MGVNFKKTPSNPDYPSETALREGLDRGGEVEKMSGDVERLRARIAELESECRSLRSALDDRTRGRPSAGAEVGRSDLPRGPTESISELTGLKAAEAELRHQRGLYEIAAQLARLGHFVWDEVEERSLVCSEELARITGMTVESYLATYSSYEAVLGMVHPDDRAHFDAVLSKAFDDKTEYEVDFRVILPDGIERHFREHGEPVLDESGSVIRTIGIQQDITELKAVEKTLRESERRFRDFAAISAHWLWETGPDGRFTYISEGISTVTGEKPEDIIGRTRLELAGPDSPDAETLMSALAPINRQEAFDDFVYSRRAADGRLVQLAISGKPIFSESGSFLGCRGAARDVTALRAVQASLQKTDALYRETERLSRLGHWEWDEVRDRCVFCSEELARLHGVTVEEFLALACSSDGDLSFVHPDDRERYTRAIEKARSEGSDLRLDYRLQARTGEVREVREVGEFITDDTGRPIRSFGFVQDLSELKTIEASLRNSEAALARAQEIAGIGNWHRSVETGDLLSFSEQFARIHGLPGDTTADEFRLRLDSAIHPGDRDRVVSAMQKAAKKGRDYRIEYRIIQPDGQVRQVQEIGEAQCDDRGIAVAYVGTVQDITDRKQVEDALRESEARFRDFAESASDWFWETDAAHRLVGLSGRSEESLGMSPDALIGRTRWEVQGIDPSSDPHWEAHLKVLEAHQPFQGFEYVHRRGGKAAYLTVSGRPIFDDHGRFLGYRGTASDISEPKRAEMALQQTKDELDERVRQRTAELRQTNETLVKEIKVRERAEAAAEQSRALLAQAVEALDEGFVIFDADERLVLCNSKYREIYAAIGAEQFQPGAKLEDVARATARHCIGLTREAEIDDWVEQYLSQHRGGAWPSLQRHLDGRWVRIGESDLPNGWNVGTRTDITEIKAHELDLAEQARSIGLLQRIGSAISQAVEIDAAIQICLDEVCDYTGWPVGHAYLLESDDDEDLVVAKAWAATDPDRFADLHRSLAGFSLKRADGLPGRVLESGEPSWLANLTSDPRFASDQVATAFGLRSACAFPVPIGAGKAVVLEFLSDLAERPDEQTMATMRSVGQQLGRTIERKLSDDAIKRSEQQLRQVIDVVPLLIFAKSVDGRFTLANQAVADLMGVPVDDLIGRTAQDFLNPDEDASEFRANDQAVISGLVTELVAEERLANADGQVRILRTIKVPFRQSGHESPVVLGVAMDVTEERETERQLQQAQKMDAVGKLTGGVAHDFNNLLFVIQGNLQLLEEQVADSPEASQLIVAIKRAAGLGADLTRSLLAFSRQQPLKPELLDLVPVIEGSIALLRRTLSEEIQIETDFASSSWQVLIDGSQLENAIINLAVNARDAMPDGGTLRITMDQTRVVGNGTNVSGPPQARLAPGDYVRLEVSDTGCGMRQEVIEQAFEPFFTTKKPGSGTGLGLSMVYGFVAQSGGRVEIRSTIDHGTSVIILLPRARDKDRPPETAEGKDDQAERTRATILVTEDNEEVLRVAVRLLKRLGYDTLEAGNGKEALELLDRSPQVSLLFTDVIMPGGMNGRQLAEEAQRRRPDLKVLFSSGHSQSAIIRDGKLEDGVELITKPYQSDELAKRIAQILSSDREI